MSKTKQKTLKKDVVFFVLFLTPLVAALSWSLEPSVKSLWGAYKLQSITVAANSFSDHEAVKKIKRKIQMHFLDYNIYIPLEDIITTNRDANNKMFNELMNDVCGNADLYIWLPMPVRIPVLQTKTFEYCWKPKLVYK